MRRFRYSGEWTFKGSWCEAGVASAVVKVRFAFWIASRQTSTREGRSGIPGPGSWPACKGSAKSRNPSALTCSYGNLFSGGAFKDHVKLHFFKGASLEDPAGLFNGGLDAKFMRAIDWREGEKINEAPLKDLIRAAVARNAQ
ncbi:MAG: DUF1801 domain-containing protein [Actinomycetota bacterium]